MKFGTCGLCLRQRDLCQSHLVPRSVYKRIWESGKFVHMSNSGVQENCQVQIKAPFLCADCEKLFRENGEDCLGRECFQAQLNNESFPLLEKLLNHKSITIGPGFLAKWQVPDTCKHEIAQLEYFALSFLWRYWAGFEKWGVDGDGYDLGPYGESIRRYLLGECVWPRNCSVSINVMLDANSDTFNVGTMACQPIWNGSTSPRVYQFLAPGLHFSVSVGGSVCRESNSVSLVLFRDTQCFFELKNLIANW